MNWKERLPRQIDRGLYWILVIYTAGIIRSVYIRMLEWREKSITCGIFTRGVAGVVPAGTVFPHEFDPSRACRAIADYGAVYAYYSKYL